VEGHGGNVMMMAVHSCISVSRRTEYRELCIGVGAQSTLGGHDIFARKICMKKITKFSNFTRFLPEK